MSTNSLTYFKSALIATLCVCGLGLGSCKKYLAAKPNINLEVPSTVQDMQALLNDNQAMNLQDPELGDVSCDDYYVLYSDWQAQWTTDQGLYVWDPNVIFDNWSAAYTIVATANVVLDNISTATGADSASTLNTIKGEALFFRAWEFYWLASVYSPAYDSTNYDDPLGICLRLSSSVTEPSVRSTVKQTYDQIIADLSTAASLLPATNGYPTNPNRAGAFGALARTYLEMMDYTHAEAYSDSCLKLNSSLLQLSTLDTTSTLYSSPFNLFNSEVDYHSEYSPSGILFNSVAKVDTTLIGQYAQNDLRRLCYFAQNADGSYGFIGNYATNWGAPSFDGIATDEIYLIKAECEARRGDVSDAMGDLNTLLVTRWRPGTFVPYTAVNASDALNQILTERRKELVFRNLRWSDLKRLNQNQSFAVTLTRNLNGTPATLAPGDLRYALLIPANVISIAHISQNPR